MRTSQTIRLPQAVPTYSQSDEQVMRRTAEQAMQDLRGDVISVRDQLDRSSSLSVKRFQFLLMGASGG